MSIETSTKELLHALRATGNDQHRCFGCGYEHNCTINGCAVNNAAAKEIEMLAGKAHRKTIDSISQMLQNAGFEEASKFLDCKYEF